MKMRFLAAALAVAAVCSPPAHAQPPVLDGAPPPIVQRVSALERDNVQIKARLTALEKGKAVAPIPAATAKAKAALPELFVLNGQFVSKEQFYAASGVASADPFDCPCPADCNDGTCTLTGCAAECSTTPTIGVIGAATRGTTLTYGLAPSGGYVTSIGAGRAATYGGTSSACDNGACAAPARERWYPGKLLGR